MKPNTEFKRWFKKQFGQTPSTARLVQLRIEVSRLQEALNIAEYAVRKEERLHTAEKAALYSMQMWGKK